MNLFASIGIVVGIGLFVAALYGVYYYITVWVPEQKHLEEEIQRLQKMEHDLDSDSDSDLDSESSDSEEEFQDLRHHRMYQQIPLSSCGTIFVFFSSCPITAITAIPANTANTTRGAKPETPVNHTVYHAKATW